MGKMQRDKGKAGEREVVKLFRIANGWCGYTEVNYDGAEVPVARNHDQAERGGHDIVGVPFFAPEVKRVAERPGQSTLVSWWEQACEQADIACKEPLVVYRANHQPWRVLVWVQLWEVNDEWYMANLHWEEFVDYYKRRLLKWLSDQPRAARDG